MIAPAIAQTMIAPITISRKFTWMPGSDATNSLTPKWMPCRRSTPGEVVGGQPADGERAERVEGHVAEVEQAREAHHEVQPERHHHVGEGEDAVVHVAVERRAEQREQRDGHHATMPGSTYFAHGACAQFAERAHPASRVSSPIRPCGRKTMISTR